MDYWLILFIDYLKFCLIIVIVIIFIYWINFEKVKVNNNSILVIKMEVFFCSLVIDICEVLKICN